MSRAVRGTGEINREFDRRLETIEKLDEAEELSEIGELLDWISSDPKVRRNLDGPRYNALLLFRGGCPEHGVWTKVDEFLRIRQAQNSVARKKLLREQREGKTAISVDPDSDN